MRYIDQYIEEKSIEIHAAIAGRKIIYLDLKYWILLRDALHSNNDNVAYRLAAKVMELYEDKKCIFPVSEMVFWEIMKQQDRTSLLKTFQLVEKLSEGIAILSDKQRVKVEFACWYSENITPGDLPRLNKLIWSRLPLISGYFFYSIKVEELPEGLRRSFLDFVGEIPWSDIVSQFQGTIVPFSGRDDIDAMNHNKEKYKHENKSRTQMFLSELWGILDCFTEQFNEVEQAFSQRKTGLMPTAEEIDNADKASWQKAIYHLFKMGKITTELPTFKIAACLAGAMRWNKNRIYKDGNDTIDIMHVCTALPYCDYFFTERELHTLIVQDKLHELFQCVTESKPEKVLEQLELL